MNPRNGGALLAIGLLAASCSATREATIREEIGPAPLRATAPNAAEGSLVVYSAREVTATPNDIDEDIAPHTPYDIRTVDGTLVKHVKNHDDLRTEPDSVALPAGDYRVAATAQEYGTVIVPVEIIAGRTTTVHLDSNDFAGARRTPTSAMIRLPDGQVVGSVAGPAEKR